MRLFIVLVTILICLPLDSRLPCRPSRLALASTPQVLRRVTARGRLADRPRLPVARAGAGGLRRLDFRAQERARLRRLGGGRLRRELRREARVFLTWALVCEHFRCGSQLDAAPTHVGGRALFRTRVHRMLHGGFDIILGHVSHISHFTFHISRCHPHARRGGVLYLVLVLMKMLTGACNPPTLRPVHGFTGLGCGSSVRISVQKPPFPPPLPSPPFPSPSLLLLLPPSPPLFAWADL